MARQRRESIRKARELRARQTKAERLLWNVLRNRRLCGLRFRRQHPIGPFIVDFACIEKRIVVELDGGYHDDVYDSDLRRQKKIERMGWLVLRFRNEDVLRDAEAVAIAIARVSGRNPNWESQ
ncbi:MAG: hypothetical protein KatS3mg110_1896 [Pirellulaceae bacterium]|nr:MAG: hypothetical protein KatS3mg110_1891 [Pirellulaceae bacterium]GIW93855.1 MAG: hypothetical protein KatS3mg110_1896 [Pirellulaceae bacterium]